MNKLERLIGIPSFWIMIVAVYIFACINHDASFQEIVQKVKNFSLGDLKISQDDKYKKHFSNEVAQVSHDLTSYLGWSQELANSFASEVYSKHLLYRTVRWEGEDLLLVGPLQLTHSDARRIFGRDCGYDILSVCGTFENDLFEMQGALEKGHISQKTFHQFIRQWKEFDPRFDPVYSRAILVESLASVYSDPQDTAKWFLEGRSDKTKPKLISATPSPKFSYENLDMNEVRISIRRQIIFKTGDYIEQPWWFYAVEGHQLRAMDNEHTIYKSAVRFMTVTDIAKAKNKGRLVLIQSVPEIGLIVDPTIGKLDLQNQDSYQTLRPELWSVLKEGIKRLHNELDVEFIVISATRTVAYQNKMGNASVCHPTGFAVDIQIDTRQCWRWVHAKEVIELLRRMCPELGIDFYVEAPLYDHLHIFLVED